MGSTKKISVARGQRAALTQAIGDKVQSLGMGELLQLASELEIKLPTGLKRARGPVRPPQLRREPDEPSVLKGDGFGQVVPVSEGMKHIEVLTIDEGSVDWAESELVGAGELVQRLDIARATLDNWRKAHKILAFRKGLRNFVYPVRQFERLKPVEGLDLVCPLFSSSEECWEWLVAPNRMTEGRAPIDVLRDGDIAAVTNAAEGALDYA